MAGRYEVANKEDRTADGIVFDSRKEMIDYVNIFRPLINSGITVKRQVRFPLWAHPGVHYDDMNRTLVTYTPAAPVKVSEYIADFVVVEKVGHPRIYESKGHRTAEYKRTAKWFHACYPELRIVEI